MWTLPETLGTFLESGTYVWTLPETLKTCLSRYVWTLPETLGTCQSLDVWTLPETLESCLLETTEMCGHFQDSQDCGTVDS